MIEVQNLHFTYPKNSLETIKGLDFNIKKGEIFGFLGPSGAGKSTIQKVLIGILKNFKGKVEVLGEDMGRIQPNFYERIGVSFEFPNLFLKFTALENLEFFQVLYQEKTEALFELLKMVGLEKEADTRVANFSKGMKMRLSFCRAFLNNPEVIFLDEPTSGLDPVNARRIKDIILKKKAEGKTIFITTHNMKVAEDLCDRVAFIVDGRLSLIDSPRELMVRRSRKRVRVEYRDGEILKTREFHLNTIGENKDFINLIKGKQIETIHSQEANLEDVFIEVTGRRLI